MKDFYVMERELRLELRKLVLNPCPDFQANNHFQLKLSSSAMGAELLQVLKNNINILKGSVLSRLSTNA